MEESWLIFPAEAFEYGAAEVSTSSMRRRETASSSLCDMVWDVRVLRHQYLDHHVFGFAERHGAVRKTYMTAVGRTRR